MGTCKGNRGNLLQHWVLCELLDATRRKLGDQAHLHYIDAHAMPPFSAVEDGYQPTRRQFENARATLPGQGSLYERAWHRVTNGTGEPYPSSAVFVADNWLGPLSMCLCEIDPATAAEIEAWRQRPENDRFGRQTVVLPRTWRQGFEWRPADLTLIQFDPYFYDPNRDNHLGDGARMHPQDLELLGGWLDDKPGRVVVQLTSYASMRVPGSDPAAEVDASATEALNRYGFRRECSVAAQGDMVSLVFSRDLVGGLALADAAVKFPRWLKKIPTA